MSQSWFVECQIAHPDGDYHLFIRSADDWEHFKGVVSLLGGPPSHEQAKAHGFIVRSANKEPKPCRT